MPPETNTATVFNLPLGIDHRVACTHAYHGISVNTDGTVDPCCQYSPGKRKNHRFENFDDYVNNVRLQMHADFLAGRQHEGCAKCYQEENLGMVSMRQSHTRSIPIRTNLPVNDRLPIYHVELRLGNLCNLKCMMCNPFASTSIATERWQHTDRFKSLGIRGIITKGHASREEWWETEEFHRFADQILPQAKKVNITGGEPFMIPEVSKILDTLAQRANFVAVSFNTNATILPDGVIEKLQKFKKIKMFVSTEGTGRMNEYIRYPSKWSDIHRNIGDLATALGREAIQIHHTLQHTSVYSLPDLTKYCYDLDLPLSFTTVQGIECLNFNSVPEADMAKFIQWLEDQTMLTAPNRHFLHNAATTAKFDLGLYRDYRRYVRTLDDIRGTDYDQVFEPAPVVDN